MLSGSVAMSIYVVPRATRDMDFIVHLKPEHISKIIEHFKEGYYCDRAAIEEAFMTKGMFNIIDHTSGFKADFVILKNTSFRQTEFDRRQQVDFIGMPIYVVSAEDLLLSKLIWIQELQSALQIQDIESLLQLETIDREYVSFWIKELNLNTFGFEL